MNGNVLSEFQSQKTYSYLLKDKVGLQAITLGLRQSHDRIGRYEDGISGVGHTLRI
ncbi:MAG: hypothetical protein KIT39_12650 [Nitrospirales bacterium]|nr:hypothetical protein [Nitrospirales bacterium]